MLAIEVAFLTGRYVATAYHSRDEGEWPPHPARLFSALAATHFSSVHDDRDAERAALEWLAGQGAPSIVAADASTRDLVTVFVPVNDVALTDVDAEAEARDDAQTDVAEADASGDSNAVRKSVKSLTKADVSLKRAIERATAIPAKPMNPRYGQRVLPDFRGRQPRTFPSVTPADPRVTYVWHGADPTADQRLAIDRLLERLVRLGHSSSFVSARLIDHPGPATWRPAPEGEATLRVVGAGQLAALERAFERHREIEPRVMPAVQQAYTQLGPGASEATPRSLFSEDWLVFRRVEGPHLPITSTAGIARAFRRALMSFAPEPITELISGHTPDGRPTEKSHLAIVPLPFIGHEHASGTILGVALVFPRGAAEGERRAVYSAIDVWEQRFRMEDEDTPPVQLNLGAAGELRLERVELAAAQQSLRSRTWCGPGRVWYSATPVALDRNPGNLRSRDSRELADAIRQAEESVRRACERIGLPNPAAIEILPAAPWVGSAKARHFPPFPGDANANRIQRVLTHVQLEFDEYVAGPILLGAGRYVGLGLCRPQAPR